MTPYCERPGNSDRIYLDNAATTRLRKEVAELMTAVDAEGNYNPSSLHAEGRRARAALDAARERIAALLGAAANEIVFTSCGTESDNLALFGVAAASPRGAHIVASAIEHHAVTAALERLADRGYRTTELPVGRQGRIDCDGFAAALEPTTVLASVMYANNEVGTIQPISELAAIARARGVLFHTDAIQTPNWLPIDVGGLGVDLMTLSAHKFGGPKGVGILYVRRGVPIAPVLAGGGQESGRRSGTENVSAIVATAEALALAGAGRVEQSARVSALRDCLEAGILAAVPEVRVNGAEPRLPNMLNLSFAGITAAELLIALDLAGIAVSAGSACTSGILEPSHVLAAMHTEPEWQTGAIRLSLGVSTSAVEIDRVLAILPPVVAGMRQPARVAPGGMGRIETNGARLEAEA
jgi:cysteine desulfurase